MIFHLSSEHVEIPEVLLYNMQVHITLGFGYLFSAERLVIFLDLYFRWVIHRFTITGKQKLSLPSSHYIFRSFPIILSSPLCITYWITLFLSLSRTFSFSFCFVIYTQSPHEVPQVFSQETEFVSHTLGNRCWY